MDDILLTRELLGRLLTINASLMHCNSCGENYLEGRSCSGCGTTFEAIILNYVDPYPHRLEANLRVLIEESGLPREIIFVGRLQP